MSKLPICQFYCLSFNNQERKNNMIERFVTLGIDCKFYDGVQYDDSRLKNRNLNDNLLREWSRCYGHLDMIADFYYESDKCYGIFCEDDIHIHKDIVNIMPKILTDFNILNLDILLLGYLTPFTIDLSLIDEGFSLKKETRIKPKYCYHNYPDDLTGSQMYVINRKHANTILDKYYKTYADKTLSDSNKCFISDYLIPKEGNRALISPILSVKEKFTKNKYHKKCHKVHYVKDKFI